MPKHQYQIAKSFEFSASHQLAGLPESHPCSRLHGHNYTVELVLKASQTNDVGFVVDYRELTQFKEMLDSICDHRHLNDVFPKINPTAEYLARTFHGWARSIWPQIVRVRVSETSKTWAEYSEVDE